MNSRQQFEHRTDTRVITLSEVAQEFAEPERLRLQLSSRVRKKPFDIGSFAYVIRGKNDSVFDDRGTPVVIESFVESRRELIVRLLESFVGQRGTTVLTRLRAMEYFIDWLNMCGYREVFASAGHAQQAYLDFTAHLNHQIAHQVWKPLTARNIQVVVSKLIEHLYPEDSYLILAGAVTIRSRSGSAAASATHVETYWDVCLAIAQQCSAFVLNNQPYPFVVTCRDYEVVVFPSNQGSVGPFRQSLPLYNAVERRIATVEEFQETVEKMGRTRPVKSVAERALSKAKANLNAANEDNRCRFRLQVAGLAAKAYASLFVMITGATPAEFQQFSYADALDVAKSPIKKELSAVKFRAGGKATRYNIGRYSGLPLLKEYLKLREWILNGASQEALFFSMPASGKLASADPEFPDIKLSGALSSFFASISGIFLDPKVPRLSPRKMRKCKSLGMHTAGVSPSAVATALNHSGAVNLSTYSEATPEQQEAELGQFWRSVHHAAQVVRERSQRPVENVIATGAGHCNGFNHPIPSRGLGSASIEPNCRSQYGCLYCEHFICHSDEEDLHKLVSLQYVINAVRKTARDTAHAEALYKELSIRIEFILEALGEHSDAVKRLVETIKVKVFEYGELTLFWEKRLSRYEKMGVVF
ncbi:hypothetical protein [Pseudomonas sp. efr-133-TYG-103a]|uniref:hypothetical protein n=1 Tax=Pseudomonas sp. efr-133-TYG-103a TaxID=3040308 RepID=UPI00255556E3|nr:hypothetical protein [Pseudomonas sp. efr-133-TYG-103a]